MRKALLLILVAFTFRLYSQGYVCAIGGGSENYNSWSDAPYSWIVQKSDSGKIIILGVSSATSWLPDYFMSFGADTAYNKTINSRAAANLQETAILVNEEKSAGNHKIIFDASYLPSGVYFYRLFLGNNSTTKSMLLLK